MKVNAYGVVKKGQSFEKFQIDLEDLKADEVQVKVKYCGICHSDIHLLDDDWAEEYPVIPGHEIVGEITEIGSNVKDFKKGMIVGVGWQCGSCGKCKSCMKGKENLCGDMVSTCVNKKGGFAELVNIDENFVFEIPDEMDLAKVGPLFCGGATVYNPLEKYGIKARDNVAIIGIGGLGHLAIQFAKALGTNVTAISSSVSKKEDSFKLGASNFISTDEELEKYNRTFDFILSTASADLDWNKYLKALAPEGKLCFVGVPSSGEIKIDYFELMIPEREIVAGSIASPTQIKKLIKLAAEKNVYPIVEMIKPDQLDEAFEKLRNNQVRYRFIVDFVS